ncbi:MAG TPA: hypothetical protein VF650_12640 [Allosphingosinicella sp.]
MFTESRAEPAPAGEPQIFEKLRELARNGYVPDPDRASGGGILLRHESAPDLVLRADGRIDLPLGQRPRSVAALAPSSPAAVAEARRMSKRRTLLIVLLAAAFWFMSLALTSSIISG